jgi:hypothetical protein
MDPPRVGDPNWSGSGAGRRGQSTPDAVTWAVAFWSADWTPWRALAAITTRWPLLRFEMRPIYTLP